MAYTDRRSSNHRASTIIVVAVLEAAVIYGVIQGLANTFTPEAPPPSILATDIPIDPPKPPPEPSPLPSNSPLPRDREIDIAGPVNDFRKPDRPPIAEPEPFPQPSPSPTFVAVAEQPKPKPMPSFTPKSANPRNNPASWATPNDYPSRDLREGNQGITKFRLTVSAEGKVLDCAIVETSGFPGLDRAACDNIARRAKFEPATDSSGARVAGTYSNKIRWVIPD